MNTSFYMTIEHKLHIRTLHFTAKFNFLVCQAQQDPEQLRKNVHFCRGCSKFLPRSEFSLTLNARTVGLCRHCKELDNEARHREDFFYYKTILKRLRKDESEVNPDAKIPYLLQVEQTFGHHIRI